MSNPPLDMPARDGSVRGSFRHGGSLYGEMLRFGIAGVLNVTTCLVLLFLLNKQLHVNLWIASFTGYAVATVQNFLISKHWTFAGNHRAHGGVQFVVFVIVNAIGSGIFSTGVNLLTPGLGLFVASIASAGVTLVFNFLCARTIVFRRTPPSAGTDSDLG